MTVDSGFQPVLAYPVGYGLAQEKFFLKINEEFFDSLLDFWYWFSLIVLQAFDFKLDRRDEPHLNSQYLHP